MREEKTNIFKLVDGKKDAIQVICSINDQFYRNVILEEHYVIVGEPGELFINLNEFFVALFL